MPSVIQTYLSQPVTAHLQQIMQMNLITHFYGQTTYRDCGIMVIKSDNNMLMRGNNHNNDNGKNYNTNVIHSKTYNYTKKETNYLIYKRGSYCRKIQHFIIVSALVYFLSSNPILTGTPAPIPSYPDQPQMCRTVK